MSRKKQQGTGSKIFSYLMLIPAFFSLIGNLCAMMKAELAIMRKRIVVLSFLFIFLLVLMIMMWMCINAMLFHWMLTLALNTGTAYVIVLSFNFVCFIITCLSIALLRFDPTFPETRKAINDIISK